MIALIKRHMEEDVRGKTELKQLAESLHENYFSCNGLKRVLFDGE